MSEMDIIFSKINTVKNCLMAIERAQRDEKDAEFQLSIYELNLQRAIQACVDMAHVLIAKEGLGLPSTYRQSFEILAKHKIITPSQLKILIFWLNNKLIVKLF